MYAAENDRVDIITELMVVEGVVYAMKKKVEIFFRASFHTVNLINTYTSLYINY